MNQVFHIEDYNSPLPDLIYIDTSFLYEVYSNDPENRFQNACYNFTNRLAANGTIMIVSELVFEELDHVILKGIYRQYANRIRGNNIGWLDLYKGTKKHMPEVVEEIKRIRTLIRGNPNIVDLPIEVNNEFALKRIEAMNNYSMDSGDASHIVAAFGSSTNSFATVDQDYEFVPNINIFTPNNNYVFSKSGILLPFPSDEEQKIG